MDTESLKAEGAIQAQAPATLATGQQYLPGKVNFPTASLFEPTEVSVTQLPELKSNTVCVRNWPACIPPAGHIPEWDLPSVKDAAKMRRVPDGA